ncbi:ABC transporter permease [Actinokineospora bangkokensis]|uniref:Peptide ABC transporter permease n=1 Tax=Actinokineospora bangkokensis TaxID=1193682 RepID=A0A1Q9LMG9_9PSEU|nr:ABC transporter permease [Actinokineospora bangkokensis]OLR93220.1 peptide ABC transporter permease [Actinokineospora bangkokensis]
MLTYLAGRVAQALFVVWAAFTTTFIAVRLLPGDPVALMLNGRGDGESASPAEVARVSAELGFDRPVLDQYLGALVEALHGDFGRSIQTGQPVSAMISAALPGTLRLGAAALVLALLAGTALAVAANHVRSPLGRQVLRSVPSIAVSMPSFWVGLMLIQVFSLDLGLLPSLGDDGFASLVLPACTLAIPGTALVGQVLSKSLHATLHEPYADTARAVGASRLRVLLGHGLRNAAIPAVTVFGLLTGSVIGGSVLVETVFARPGMGRDIFFAVSTQDLPVVQGVVVVASLAFVVVNLAVDLLYPVLDPRIRSTGRAAVAR